MLYSHDWLRTFVPHSLSSDEVAALVGRHVATVDGVRPLREDLATIVVARVVEASRHPNSDHLWVTKVDDGSGALQDVVCGAPNVVAGTLYPFARVGTVMPTGNKGGILIERRKIRGEWSNGMLCSSRELGLGEDHDGIMPLDLEVPTGTPLLAAMPLGDTIFDVDVLPNRPDLFCHRGLAREVGALTGAPVRTPAQLIAQETGGQSTPVAQALSGDRDASSGGLHVRVDDREGCPRYMAVVIRGVTVGPSPAWLAGRLEALGARPISNVVDATNYMLHAVGQPMHAFDLARLGNATIVVRDATAGEKIVTLDGVERTLAPGMTVIADANRAVAIGGVMGGRDSEVTASTRDIVLEVAYFDPRRTRRTRRTLGLSTDASHRFERGVETHATADALAAAAQLIVAVAGGTVETPVDVGAPPAPPAAVQYDVKRGARLLGDTVDAAEATHLLTSLGCQVTTAASDVLRVVPPTWRRDLLRDADLVEELARLRGYDRLPDTLSAYRPGTVPDHPHVTLVRRVREFMVGQGFNELRPMPFVRGTDQSHVRVANPLAEDEPHLRRFIFETLTRAAEHNLARMQGDLRLFEAGAVFAPGEPGGLPRESLHVGVLLMGLSRPPHFTDPKPPAFDAWDARYLGEELARIVFGEGCSMSPQSGDYLWLIEHQGTERGRIFRASLDKPAWAHDAFCIELWAGAVDNTDVAPAETRVGSAHDGETGIAHPRYQPLPLFPAAEFDLALLLPEGVTVAAVEAVMREAAGPTLERMRVFDEYFGKELPPNTRSVAWRLTLRDATRTLRDKEVEGRRSKILQTLEKALGIRPRSH
jgi:phenylalanyl-tRNA synthetase beta chain